MGHTLPAHWPRLDTVTAFFKWSWLGQLRRIIGLHAVFYIALHVTAYVVVDQGLDSGAIWHDILKRPYITVGVAGLLVLLPLAATSTNGMIRRLGGPRWKRLHRLAYIAPVLAVLHYLLLVKADATWPLLYAAILCSLLASRVLPQVGHPVNPASILARSQ